jgi:hypothetical protein
MFDFPGTIDSRRFLVSAGIRVGLFVAAFFAFPFLTYGFAASLGCLGASSGGGCQLVGMILGMAYKPLVFVAFVVSFLGISVRRARDAGLVPQLGLIIPLLFIVDIQYLVFAGAPWSMAFTYGVLSLNLPHFAFLALALSVVLGLMQTRQGRIPFSGFGQFGVAATGLGAFVAVFALIALLGLIPGSYFVISMATRPIAWLGFALPYVMLGFLICSALAARHSRTSLDVSASTKQPAMRASGRAWFRWQWILLVVAALVVTGVVMVIGVPDLLRSGPIGPMMMMPAIIPTFFLYLAAISALYALVVRRTWWSLLACVVVTIPFVHWGASRMQTDANLRAEAAEVAALPIVEAESLPSVVLFRGKQNRAPVRELLAHPKIEAVLVEGDDGITQYRQPDSKARRLEERMIDRLPRRYLLLAVGEESTLVPDPRHYAHLSPYELRLVSPDGNHLIGGWYQKHDPGPRVVPIVGGEGWLREDLQKTTDEIDDVIAAFVADAIGGSRAEPYQLPVSRLVDTTR